MQVIRFLSDMSDRAIVDPVGARRSRFRWKPQIREGNDAALCDRRQTIASLFIVVLLGIAYQEMLSPVRDEIRSKGFSISIVFFVLTFFCISMRFFIGNQLHLMCEGVKTLRGDIWLRDFFIIIIEAIFICFLGGVSAPAINEHIPVNFYHLIVIICGIDVAWVLLQWMSGMAWTRWKADFIPWSWAVLNTIVAALTLLIYWRAKDPFGSGPAVAVFAVNLAAFFVDIVLIDYQDLI